MNRAAQNFMRDTMSIALLDFADVRRSRWLVFCMGLYALLSLAFLFVGMRESGVFGFTGSGRVLGALSHTLLLLLPLLALAGTTQVINRARDEGALELLFSQPLSRLSYLTAITLVRYAAVLIPLLVFMLGIALFGQLIHGEAMPWYFLGHCLTISAALLWAFTAIGLFISTRVRSATKAMMYMLLIWVTSVALLDIALAGMMLQWRVNPRLVFTLALLNPVQAARMGFLSAAEPELAVLGPIGFYLVTHIGSRALFLGGILWPLAVGTLSWIGAARSFCKRDLT